MSKIADLQGLSIRPSNTRESIPLPSRKWFSRTVLPVTIVVVALALLGFAARHSLSPAVDVQIVRVVTKRVAGASGSVTVQAPGWVEADPFPIYVPALSPGVVEEVLVLEGERVQAGQIVVRMISDDARLALEAAQARLADRRAKLSLAEAVLRAARSDWDHPIERDRAVAAGQAVLEQTTAERAQLDAEIAVQEAKLAELLDHHRRLEALGPDAASRSQVVQAALRRDAQRATLEMTEQNKGILDARVVETQANLVAARAHRRLRIAERRALEVATAEVETMQAQIVQAQVEVAQAQLRLDRMEVRSPVAGVVMTRLAVPGSKLMLDMDSKLSANAMHLYDPNKLQVRVDVPLADAAQVGIGQQAEVTVDVLPDTRFAGHVTRIVHEADIQKNTLQVKVAIRDPIPQLKPEMLARVRFLAGGPTDTGGESALRAFVPERLLRERAGTSATVWLVTATHRATRRSITLGTKRQAGWIEVVSGINPGDVLIADPPDALKEGQRVRVAGELEG